jgi:hypothetical protein
MKKNFDPDSRKTYPVVVGVRKKCKACRGESGEL